jgi:DNA-binding protein HU-beta
MTKQDLITKMAESGELTKKDAALALNALLNIIKDELAEGNAVNMLGFGKFHVTQRNERIGHNPKTMEKVVVPAKKVPKFKFSSIFVESVK